MSMIILISAPFLFNAQIPEILAGYFVALIMLIVSSLSIGMIFGLFFKSASKIGMATQLIFLPSIMLSGIMFSVSLLPSALQAIGKLSPATWAFLLISNKILDINNLIP